jgi:NhaP-type Na+/H+ or K+/H+ antiporter
VLIAAAFAAPDAMAPAEGWALFTVKQVTLGPLAGVFVGCIGGWVLLRAKALGTTSDTYEGIGALALAAAAYLGAESIGGNGFIAAFSAGLGFGAIVQGRCKFIYEFTESEGQLLSWAAFFLLGAVLVPDAIMHLTGPMLVMILVSLFVIRPLAIWLSLLGSGADTATKLFFGWFGPRGLATALFALLVVGEIGSIADDIVVLAVNAVWISAVLHGISAVPLARRYAARMNRIGPMPDHQTPITDQMPKQEALS